VDHQILLEDHVREAAAAGYAEHVAATGDTDPIGGALGALGDAAERLEAFQMVERQDRTNLVPVQKNLHSGPHRTLYSRSTLRSM